MLTILLTILFLSSLSSFLFLESAFRYLLLHFPISPDVPSAASSPVERLDTGVISLKKLPLSARTGTGGRRNVREDFSFSSVLSADGAAEAVGGKVAEAAEDLAAVRAAEEEQVESFRTRTKFLNKNKIQILQTFTASIDFLEETPHTGGIT